MLTKIHCCLQVALAPVCEKVLIERGSAYSFKSHTKLKQTVFPSWVNLGVLQSLPCFPYLCTRHTVPYALCSNRSPAFHTLINVDAGLHCNVWASRQSLPCLPFHEHRHVHDVHREGHDTATLHTSHPCRLRCIAGLEPGIVSASSSAFRVFHECRHKYQYTYGCPHMTVCF